MRVTKKSDHQKITHEKKIATLHHGRKNRFGQKKFATFGPQKIVQSKFATRHVGCKNKLGQSKFATFRDVCKNNSANQISPFFVMGVKINWPIRICHFS